MRRRIAFLILILTLGMAIGTQTANELAVENVQVWCWGTERTDVSSVAVADVDGDGKADIVTGGSYVEGVAPYDHGVAQLCVWDGATLTLKGVKTWLWGMGAGITSLAVGDVDGDGKVEIVTGGSYNDGVRSVAQLCVWNGATLALKSVETWYWTGDTYINSVALGDVDGDGKAEVVTGGWYWTGSSPQIAQLCVWNGATLAFKGVRTWYWGNSAYINSVAVSDSNDDGKAEIVTGGYYSVGTPSVCIAQLCVWDGATLALDSVTTWKWGLGTFIHSVALGDPNGDHKTEIVTGGDYYTGGTSGGNPNTSAQLCVWDGATMTLDNVKVWCWGSLTTAATRLVSVDIYSIFGYHRIVTGGYYFAYDNSNNPHWVAQACVWNAGTLALIDVAAWCWGDFTMLTSVYYSDVNGDHAPELLTGGFYWTYIVGQPQYAQLCVWA